jgi:predicted flavoprotein YhiN
LNADVIVIGGGASGLMAAGRAAELGARVLLLEKMGRVGIKLALTGKGRCNLTNGGDLPSFIESYRHNGKFLHNVFSRFFNHDLLSFFQKRGLPTVEERGRRVFPASNRAQDVVRVLKEYGSSHGVRTLVHAPAKEILGSSGLPGEDRFPIIDRPGRPSHGRSRAPDGSTGDGYRMARALGHTLQPLRPSLVPLETEERYVRDLQGLSLKNVRATLLASGQKVEEEFGEMLFTHFGVSGPIILTLSGRAVDELGRGKVEFSIDFKPALSPEQVDRRLLREFEAGGKKKILNILPNLLPQRMVPVFLRRAELPPDRKGGEIRAEARKKMVHLLKDWRLTLRKARPMEEAIVTAGGVTVKEIHPATLESRIVRGLYFCGEVIDIDGKTGGYNLQAAFSTGWAAGEAAAKEP